MTTAPKRRWFQWSLRTLFVVVTTSAVIAWALRSYLKPRDPDEFVYMANVVDIPTEIAVAHLLEANGIESESEKWFGPIGNGELGTQRRILCRRRDAPRACEFLHKAQPAFSKRLWYVWEY